MRKPRDDAHDMRGNTPKPIQGLLARYTKLRAPEGAILAVVIRVVHDVAHIKLERRDVRYTVLTKTIGLLCAGPKRHEIMLKKGEILSRCRSELGPENAPKALV